MQRVWILALGAALAACSGGGGSPVQLVFAISGTVPTAGSVVAPVDGLLVVTFTLPADLTTVTAQTLRLYRDDGTSVPAEVLAQGANPSNVQLKPLADLEPNEGHRLLISGTIRSTEGAFLGADLEICFITANPVPTVRPDQIVDLGNRLVVPRFLARAVRLADGRYVVIGGFTDPDTATDTIEVWDPASRSFELLPARLGTPRGEHTATLLGDGRVLIAGGAAEPGGAPLATTELFDPDNNGIAPGPTLNVARRWHGASRFFGSTSVMVTGGFGPTGDPLASIETLDGAAWEFHTHLLPEPTAQHVQFLYAVDTVYVSAGNLQARAAQVTASEVRERREGDIRFRPAARRIDGNRLFVVGGDTRSIVIHEFDTNMSWLATVLLRQRRGAHTLTPRGTSGHRFLAAGGFQITAGGRALATMEVVDYLPVGPFGTPDAAIYLVENVELPVPFAGHVGFIDGTGVTVLAGGWGDGAGDHSRRVVLIHDGGSDDRVDCAALR
ncbi:MAG: kelch repeat-containing protein [Planctomycetota bacterium]|jgi:hypothetical protein